MWGGVGRGKTRLMDLLVESLPPERVERTHFHHFMRGVHRRLAELAGQKNPLDQVADEVADRASLLCFDEFFVADITDAMILGQLLKGLAARQVVLVLTSNVAPVDLYRNGLQRVRFLPAIELLEATLDVVELQSETDFRLRALTQAELFYAPLGAAADAALNAHYARLTGGEAAPADPLRVEGRSIPCRARSGDTAWFNFDALCRGPRSQRDYLALAAQFNTLLISGVVIEASDPDVTRRFIFLIDVCYDQRVKLILSAASAIADFAPAAALAFEFERTQSRLLEMQSEHYLALAHLARSD